MAAQLCRLGPCDYQSVHALQVKLVAERVAGERGDIFLLTEHPGVFTLGRRGGREHLIVTEEFLAKAGIPLVHIERGGDVTFHGPGQLILYPIVDLRKARLSVTEYVHRLEELMLNLARDCGVEAGRDSRNHGIWVQGRKLGSVGIAIRHGVAFHGLALNVNISLTPFSWINPCGLAGVCMTSLSREYGLEVGIEQVGQHVPGCISQIFAFDIEEIDREELLPTAMEVA